MLSVGNSSERMLKAYMAFQCLGMKQIHDENGGTLQIDEGSLGKFTSLCPTC